MRLDHLLSKEQLIGWCKPPGLRRGQKRTSSARQLISGALATQLVRIGPGRWYRRSLGGGEWEEARGFRSGWTHCWVLRKRTWDCDRIPPPASAATPSRAGSSGAGGGGVGRRRKPAPETVCGPVVCGYLMQDRLLSHRIVLVSAGDGWVVWWRVGLVAVCCLRFA